jgi:hypothetical protein
MIVDYDVLSENSKVWVYPSNRKFYDTEIEEVHQKNNFFFNGLESRGACISSFLQDLVQPLCRSFC